MPIMRSMSIRCSGYNPGVLLLLGDALWFLGDVPRALQVYRHIEGMNYSGAFSEAAALRCMIVKEPRLNAGLRDYFYGAADGLFPRPTIGRFFRV